jgi:hypothetical protein
MARHQRLRTAVQRSSRKNRRNGQRKDTYSFVHISSCQDLLAGKLSIRLQGDFRHFEQAHNRCQPQSANMQPVLCKIASRLPPGQMVLEAGEYTPMQEGSESPQPPRNTRVSATLVQAQSRG